MPAQSIAPLLLTRLAIIVSVHLCVRTMLQEIGGFCARCHLRAVGPPIACELLAGGFRVLSRFSSNRHPRLIAVKPGRVHLVPDNSQHACDDDCENTPNRSAIIRRAYTTTFSHTCLSTRPQHTFRTLLSIRPAPDFERDHLSNARSDTISRKSRDMHEDFFMTLRENDESISPIVVPFNQRSVRSHYLNLTLTITRMRLHRLRDDIVTH